MPSVKYATLEEFEEALDDFIQFCEDTDTDPTDYQLIKFLGVSVRTLERYYSENDAYNASNNINNNNNNTENNTSNDTECKNIYKGFGTALKKIILFRQDWSSREVKKNPKLTAHISHRLKQKRWGSWTDAAKDENAGKLVIDLRIDAGGIDIGK